MHDKLASFIKYLENKGLVEFDICGPGERTLYNRFKIQQYVFLGNLFGLGLQYEYDIYLYGPRSTDLAGDCYELAENPDEYASSSTDLPLGFRQGEFMDLIQGKDNEWLEIASTLISKRESIPARQVLLENTEFTKIGFTMEFIEDTLEELEHKGLIKCDP